MSYIPNICDSPKWNDAGVVLPSELWILIFELAAGEPLAAFDTAPLPIMSFERPAWSYKTPDPRNPYLPGEERLAYKNYMDRVRLRTTLVLVSKYWRTLATSLLYEYVLLRHRPASVSFAHLMACQPTAPDSPHIGLFVKRLDIHIDETQWKDFRLDIVPAFASFFRYCSNLGVIVSPTNAPKYTIANQIEDMIFEVTTDHSPTLRYIKRNRSVLTTIQNDQAL
jgi:hypothetical protein